MSRTTGGWTGNLVIAVAAAGAAATTGKAEAVFRRQLHRPLLDGQHTHTVEAATVVDGVADGVAAAAAGTVAAAGTLMIVVQRLLHPPPLEQELLRHTPRHTLPCPLRSESPTPSQIPIRWVH